MRKYVLMMLLLMACLVVHAADSLTVEQPKKSWLKRAVENFTDIDTNYVEPQHYNWSLMMQSINTYDYYRLGTSGPDGQSVSFAPSLGIKIGPYFGWRWIFLGYTFDLRNFNLFHGKRKLEIDASIYSAQIGADVFYRRSVDGYKVRRIRLGDVDTTPLEGMAFDGLNVSITGLNLYYIFNHKRFSYPAAFAQSTCQKISCGSWMAGIGYTNHHLYFDYKRMESMVRNNLGHEVKLDSGLMVHAVKYRDFSASLGYAYNWVFAPRWLFCSSLSLALGYKWSMAETVGEEDMGFSFNNFNIDGIGRFGLVWNNTRWYAGASAIVRAYNYHKSRFAANNIFGDFCLYAGINFGPRGPYKKNKTKE